MDDRYEQKYALLLQKYMEIDFSNEKLQNRIYHIRKQIRYLRRLKRLLQQKLAVYGDRFMDVCLEIPDMEPGANVEDQIIRRVAEVPQPSTPSHGQQLIASSRGSVSSTLNSSIGGGAGSVSVPFGLLPPSKKRRRATVTTQEGITPVSGNEIPRMATIGRSSSLQRKLTATTASGASSPVKYRRESVEGSHSSTGAVTGTPTVQQVSASVEDVVNSVVFDCQQQQRNKDAEQKPDQEEISIEPEPEVKESPMEANISENTGNQWTGDSMEVDQASHSVQPEGSEMD